MLTLAEEMGVADSMKSIALGDGQGKLAEGMIDRGVEKGDWVVLQNCHLYVITRITPIFMGEPLKTQAPLSAARDSLTGHLVPKFPQNHISA